MRLHGSKLLPTLVYLPGLHGDWTLVSNFRSAVAGRVRFVEFTYPRTVTWSALDYAQSVTRALVANNILHGWLLAESFGSLVAWELVAAGLSVSRRGPGASWFAPSGLILAGGFVRHPMPWAARWIRCGWERTPVGVGRWLLRGFAQYAKLRHGDTPETRTSLAEFIARRTAADLQAMRARLDLVANADPRPIARRASLPVYHLAGFVDPIVPPPFVRPWLRTNCPGYRGAQTCWLADHNVLATATKESAETVLQWMSGG